MSEYSEKTDLLVLLLIGGDTFSQLSTRIDYRKKNITFFAKADKR